MGIPSALTAAGVTVLRAEKKTGTSREGRSELELLLAFLREGDTRVVTRIDHLAQSMKDLQDIVHELKGRGVALKATEQPIDTGTAAGKAFLDMLGVFAEFETNLRREHQLEGEGAGRVQRPQAERRRPGNKTARERGEAVSGGDRPQARDRAVIGLSGRAC